VLLSIADDRKMDACPAPVPCFQNQYCGMRRWEIIKLRRENVNFVNATTILLETKNGSSRSIGLSPRVINEMRKLPINIDGRVINFPSNDNFQHVYSQL
jgi:integrase